MTYALANTNNRPCGVNLTKTVRAPSGGKERPCMNWNDIPRQDRVEAVRSMRIAGKSCAAIGEHYGTSKNAVIGFIHRHVQDMKWSNPQSRKGRRMLWSNMTKEEKLRELRDRASECNRDIAEAFGTTPGAINSFRRHHNLNRPKEAGGIGQYRKVKPKKVWEARESTPEQKLTGMLGTKRDLQKFIKPEGVKGVAFIDLERGQCQWIYEGMPRLACGEAVKPGSAWCECHFNLCYGGLHD